MADDDDDSPARLLLIVTGSTPRAEDVDRPLAYYLRREVERQAAELDPPADPAFKVLVVADFRWLNDEPLQRLPTISVGGPGVNALAGHWVEEELEFSLAVESQYYIQMDPDLDTLRASIWGMDNPTTQIAVSVFLKRFLPRFLRRAADEEPIDLDESE